MRDRGLCGLWIGALSLTVLAACDADAPHDATPPESATDTSPGPISLQRPERKQVILISIDTLRADHLPSYGYERDTAPNLRKLAEDSLSYAHAYAAGAWTMPSHMSMLTGTLPSRHGVNDSFRAYSEGQMAKLDDSIKLVSELVVEHGVSTIRYAALPDELGFARGFTLGERRDPIRGPSRMGDFLEHIERESDKDFFAFIHTWMVHAPYSGTYYLDDRKLDKEPRFQIDEWSRLNQVFPTPMDEYREFLRKHELWERDACLDLYDSGIHKMDRYLGRMLAKLKDAGIYDNAMIIVVSDHGEHFAEHGPKFFDWHGQDLYEEFVHVPLIVKYPKSMRRPARARVDVPVSLIDVTPTILDYFGVASPDYVQGHSLLAGQPKPREVVTEALAPPTEGKMLRTADHKYMVTMESPAGRQRANWEGVTGRRLFDLRKDPDERENLCPSQPELCDRYHARLREIVNESSEGWAPQQRVPVPERTVEQMRALGYVE